MTVGDQKPRPKSARKPLHPINSPINTTTTATTKPKPKQECTCQNQNQTTLVDNKENNKKQHQEVVVVVEVAKTMESMDASLAEELSAIRKKMERLRSDRERTEKMLEERAAAMEAHIKEIQQRGEIQKMLELEVDRLYRLNQLKSYCKRVSSIRTLREKEEDKRILGEAANSHSLDEEESVGENSPCPSPSDAVTEDEK